MDSEFDSERLLSLLEAHGHAFLKSVGSERKASEELLDTDANADEWQGINTNSPPHQCSEDESSEIGSFEDSNDESIADNTSTNIVVYSDAASRKPLTQESPSSSQMKAFMSSKISKLNNPHSDIPQYRKVEKFLAEDMTNVQNDALLHKLIHTDLLSKSLNQDLSVPPAKKRKALEGRILELTGDAKLGKGEKQIRAAERNKALKRVREGIIQKQKYRQKLELEEAKNFGNYHPSLKSVFEASGTLNTRRREKGLRMGVGKFSHGSLRLSKDDISRVMGEEHSRSRRRAPGRKTLRQATLLRDER